MPGRRREDHPWDGPARAVLGLLFGGAAIYFATLHLHIVMGVFLIAAGAMLRVDLSRALPTPKGPSNANPGAF